MVPVALPSLLGLPSTIAMSAAVHRVPLTGERASTAMRGTPPPIQMPIFRPLACSALDSGANPCPCAAEGNWLTFGTRRPYSSMVCVPYKLSSPNHPGGGACRQLQQINHDNCTRSINCRRTIHINLPTYHTIHIHNHLRPQTTRKGKWWGSPLSSVSVSYPCGSSYGSRQVAGASDADDGAPRSGAAHLGRQDPGIAKGRFFRASLHGL
jgi:hypothetical protein